MNRTAELLYAARDALEWIEQETGPSDLEEHAMTGHDPANCVLCRLREALAHYGGPHD